MHIRLQINAYWSGWDTTYTLSLFQLIRVNNDTAWHKPPTSKVASQTTIELLSTVPQRLHWIMPSSPHIQGLMALSPFTMFLREFISWIFSLPSIILAKSKFNYWKIPWILRNVWNMRTQELWNKLPSILLFCTLLPNISTSCHAEVSHFLVCWRIPWC